MAYLIPFDPISFTRDLITSGYLLILFFLYFSQLKKGDVKPVDALGQHFVVYRGESGKVAVLDAYCPHLGANLALGGKVCVCT